MQLFEVEIAGRRPHNLVKVLAAQNGVAFVSNKDVDVWIEAQEDLRMVDTLDEMYGLTDIPLGLWIDEEA